MFLGEYDHTLDDRGRVTLPKRIRSEVSGNEVIVSRGFDRCIFGYDSIRFKEEAIKHLESPITLDDARRIRRYVFSAAVKIEIDKIGRIVLPAQLKEYAGVDRKVRIIGAGDHFEIWDEEKWKEYATQFEQ